MTKIEITGDAMYCQYCSRGKIFNDEYYDIYYFTAIKSITADGRELSKSERGSKITRENMLFDEMYTDEHPLPIEFRKIHTVPLTAWVELDVDDFDPSKLQLVYERKVLGRFSFGFSAFHIIYDGVEYEMENNGEDYDRWGYGEDQAFVIEAE